MSKYLPEGYTLEQSGSTFCLKNKGYVVAVTPSPDSHPSDGALHVLLNHIMQQYESDLTDQIQEGQREAFLASSARQCTNGKPCQNNCPPTECFEDCNPPGELEQEGIPIAQWASIMRDTKRFGAIFLAQETPSLRDTLAMHAPIDFACALSAWGGGDFRFTDGDRIKSSFFAVWAGLRYEYADAMLEARKSGTNTD